MRLPRILLLLVFIAFVSGCGTAPSVVSESVPKQVGADAATIVFLRPTSPPAAVKGTLYLDGVAVGEVFVRRYALLHVNPGKHEVRFGFPFWAGVATQSITLRCDANATYYISYTSLMGVAAVYASSSVVAFSITPEMKLVAETDAQPFMARFDLAFVHGEKAKQPTQAQRP